MAAAAMVPSPDVEAQPEAQYIVMAGTPLLFESMAFLQWSGGQRWKESTMGQSTDW